ncbi:MAG: imidazole glycerol phosphate synthase subunit HisH, partial [Oscillospiraceae bacterium]|nr:imidazole glycerol phosphate synthase subunit HisH [Oscillospiraceae bacterium]
ICLGMQLLLDRSFEFGEHPGLGLIHGDVVDMSPILPEGYKVPHIGWNALHLRQKDHPLLRYIQEGDCVYFVHSFYGANCDDAVLATAEYGPELTAAVGRDNVLGCQFHPEKSGPVGLRILQAFCEL